jgi:hypothetical protein
LKEVQKEPEVEPLKSIEPEEKEDLKEKVFTFLRLEKENKFLKEEIEKLKKLYDSMILDFSSRNEILNSKLNEMELIHGYLERTNLEMSNSFENDHPMRNFPKTRPIVAIIQPQEFEGNFGIENILKED